ncbi:hypothetical protein BCV69DRAFT_234624, partial [Microstroma glucosiphilum]
SFRQRMRYLWKRYGWWAFGVYNLWSLADFSLAWAVIHLFGADYIRDVETKVREAVGLKERDTADEELANKGGSSTLWTEAVLAYTIHKTLLLPFRVMGTGALTPSFV